MSGSRQKDLTAKSSLALEGQSGSAPVAEIGHSQWPVSILGFMDAAAIVVRHIRREEIEADENKEAAN